MERKRFMSGEKKIAVISDNASNVFSLQGFVNWQRTSSSFCEIDLLPNLPKSFKCNSTRISDIIEVLFDVVDLFNTKMLEEIILFFNQVFAFFQLIGDEDCDADVVREFFARRNYVFDEFL